MSDKSQKSENTDTYEEQQAVIESLLLSKYSKKYLKSTSDDASNPRKEETLPDAANSDSFVKTEVLSNEELLRELENSPLISSDDLNYPNSSFNSEKLNTINDVCKNNNTTLSELLENNTTYNNPELLTKMIKQNGIDEYGTNFSSSLYPFSTAPKFDYEKTAKIQEEVIKQKRQDQINEFLKKKRFMKK